MAQKRKKQKHLMKGKVGRMAGHGPACKTCKVITTRWERIPEAPLPPAGEWYMAYWFECRTKGCKTKMIRPKEAYRRTPKPVEPPKASPIDSKPAEVHVPLVCQECFGINPVGSTECQHCGVWGGQANQFHLTGKGKDQKLILISQMDVDHIHRVRWILKKMAEETPDSVKCEELWAQYREFGRELGRRGIQPKGRVHPIVAESRRKKHDMEQGRFEDNEDETEDVESMEDEDIVPGDYLRYAPPGV
jgi:ribosomal protein L40E